MAGESSPRSNWNKVRSARSVTRKVSRRVHSENRMGQLLTGGSESALEEHLIARAIQRGIESFARDGEVFDEEHEDRRVSFDLGDGETTMMEEFHAHEFVEIRALLGVCESEYAAVLGGKGEKTNMSLIDLGAASGKSMAWFLLSAGQRYMLKTCDANEAALLLSLMPSYVEHLRKRGTKTLLPRFYGLYTISRGGKRTFFYCMANILAALHPITARFDVKGSTAGRAASAREKSKGAGKATLKDLDLLRLGRPLVLASDGEDAHTALLSDLDADVAWLRSHDLLDYSLLVGLATRPLEDTRPLSRHIVRALHLDAAASHHAGPENLAYVGIVDILMKYSALKSFEHWTLGVWLLGDISCKPPREYAARFLGFARHVFSSDARHGYEAPPHHGAFERDWTERAGIARSAASFVLGGGAPTLSVEFGRKDVLSGTAARLALRVLSAAVLSGAAAWLVAHGRIFFD